MEEIPIDLSRKSATEKNILFEFLQGLKKQNAWIESIQEAVEKMGNTIDKDVKSLLDGIMTFDNIPRKKPKFVNFVKNVIGGGKRCSPATIEKVILYTYK